QGNSNLQTIIFRRVIGNRITFCGIVSFELIAQVFKQVRHTVADRIFKDGVKGTSLDQTEVALQANERLVTRIQAIVVVALVLRGIKLKFSLGKSRQTRTDLVLVREANRRPGITHVERRAPSSIRIYIYLLQDQLNVTVNLREL